MTSSLTSGLGSPPSGVGGVGLEAVDFAAGGAGHGADGFAVDDHPEAVVLGDDGDDLACVGHADLDLLAGDLDATTGGDPPLNRDGGFREGGGPGQADALKAVALAGWDGARQGAPQQAVLGDDVHQLAVETDAGPLPGQRGADQDQPATRLAKIAGPLGVVAQRQITARYLRSLARSSPTRVSN